MRLGEADVEPEGILDPEVARAPCLQGQRLDDAARRARRPVRGLDVVDRDHDLHRVATLACRAERPEVGMLPDGRRAAPEAEHARVPPQHEIAVAVAGVLFAIDGEPEAAVEALREREIGNVQLDEDVGTRRGSSSRRHAVAYFPKNATVARMPLK